MKSITVKAYAKINLGLDVIKKRSDGYHDLSMIMQTLNLHDTISIKETKFQSITIRSNLYYLPTDRRNLVYKAVELFNENHPIRSGLNISINKRIPVAAGLAGGSADAAATLRGLNKLCQAGLSLEELMKLGVKLGADVPYCLLMGTALSEGIGDILSPLSPMPDCSILLVKPDIKESTKHVYDNLRFNEETIHPNIQAMLKALLDNNIYTLAPLMENLLESVTIKEHPIIGEIKSKMMERKALTALMSGSGPTVFGIYDNQFKAEKAYRFFKSSGFGKKVILTKPFFPDTI